MKKKGTYLFSIMLILVIPILLLLTSVEIATFDLDFFEGKYREYDRPEKTGISHENLMVVTEELLDYLKGDRDDIVIFTEVHGEQRQVFREREIMHLVDVKILFRKGFAIRNISLIIGLLSIIFLFVYDRKKLSKSLIVSSLIPVGIMILLLIPLLLRFYETFNLFHEIFFTNDLWLLDPKTEVLIQMFPLDFFKSIAFRILSYFGVQLAVVLGLGIVISKVTKKKAQIH